MSDDWREKCAHVMILMYGFEFERAVRERKYVRRATPSSGGIRVKGLGFRV